MRRNFRNNRRITNIALPLLPLSEDALNPFQSAANRGRGNLRKLAERREDARRERLYGGRVRQCGVIFGCS